MVVHILFILNLHQNVKECLVSSTFRLLKLSTQGGTVLHRSICDVFWGLGDRSYTIIIQYGYQMKGYDFLHLVLVVLTLRGFAQATYRSNIKK